MGNLLIPLYGGCGGASVSPLKSWVHCRGLARVPRMALSSQRLLRKYSGHYIKYSRGCLNVPPRGGVKKCMGQGGQGCIATDMAQQPKRRYGIIVVQTIAQSIGATLMVTLPTKGRQTSAVSSTPLATTAVIPSSFFGGRPPRDPSAHAPPPGTPPLGDPLLAIPLQYGRAAGR